jgi:hypothetical protein
MPYSVKRQGGFGYAGIDRSEWGRRALAEHHERRSFLLSPSDPAYLATPLINSLLA